MPDNDFKKNSSGYSDPTAYLGTKAIIREENEQQRRVASLIKVLKSIIDEEGFELIARIEIRDRKTGREYR